MNIIDWISDLDVNKVGTVDVQNITFNAEFRKACESNSCGKFGKCWVCPPYVGDIHELIAKAKEYKTAVVYQTVHEIEDSFDIEGMLEGGDKHKTLSQSIHKYLMKNVEDDKFLHLSSGGCNLCKRCTILDNKPCIHPESAMASLEAYGIAVSDLAEKTNMKYINGQNTVTYFSAILLK